MELILASASPRRHEILQEAGIAHRVLVSDVDESPYITADPAQTVKNLAFVKAQAVAALPGNGDCIVLGADTVVYAGGEILGKPRDRADAERMLRLLSGGEHEVLTGIALIRGDRVARDVCITTVRFREIEPAALSLYLDSGEAMGKAGAYAIQGRAGIFIKEFVGDYKNVVGLPVFRVCDLLLSEFGVTQRELMA